MELTEKQQFPLPELDHWEQDGLHLFLDASSPHWIAVDDRGAQLLNPLGQGISFGQLAADYAAQNQLPQAKAWLHVHDFVQSLLRCQFIAPEKGAAPAYAGRAAYAQPTALRELWFHTNNVCNLACSHCLVNSAPWVKDFGLPTDRFLELIDEAVELGVDRFYFTGGEPFMRRDIFELIQRVTQTHQAELIILTNATLFKEKRAQELQKLNREKIRFQVSVDGASAEVNDAIRGKGSFENTVAGLKRLTAQGFQISLTTVVTNSNLGELSKLTLLCRELGVTSQHLMWLHRRGRAAEKNNNGTQQAPAAGVGFPTVDALIEKLRQVRLVAAQQGVILDNWESIKQRVNGRPGVKYDLGNACWDSVCIYSDGVVYPSAAMANFKPLALGSLNGAGSLKRIWQESAVAQAFRQTSVAGKSGLEGDPFRYLTGGGDLEHSFWGNLPSSSPHKRGSRQIPGQAGNDRGVGNDEGHRDDDLALAPERIGQILAGPDPYYPLYRAMLLDGMWDWARSKQREVNHRSGYDAPRLFHAMGEGAIHCATEDLALEGEMDVRTLHSNCVLAFDVDKPRKLVRDFYAQAAREPQADLCCPTKFDPELLEHIPKEVVDRFYGCGSPVTSGDLKEGETFLDLGSGAGIDVFIAANLVGAKGKAIGVDMTDEMLTVANANVPVVAKNLGYRNTEFKKGFLESVPVPDRSADLVTSNCVVNLSPDKPKVFREIWRILKDHGRVVIADIVSEVPVPAQLKVNPQLWGECIVGALTQDEFLAQLQEAGFYGLTLLKKTLWKTVEGFDFFSVTVRGHKFEKKAESQFIGQRAIYLGPMKAILDEEGNLFPRDVAVAVCADTAAKLSQPPYQESFSILEPVAARIEGGVGAKKTECEPGCC